uniref:Short-chain dehydrogenase TIC 32ic-like n=1 Tax=Rhizophora mucronata TaxID=61149 RepID=A0A2P2KJ21_RHIMU
MTNLQSFPQCQWFWQCVSFCRGED